MGEKVKMLCILTILVWPWRSLGLTNKTLWFSKVTAWFRAPPLIRNLSPGSALRH